MIVAVFEGGRQAHDWAAELADERLWVRQRAAGHLADHPHDSGGALGALAASLADRDHQVRRSAALALAAVGSPALDVLLLALGHQRAVAREWAAVLLGRLGRVATPALPALEQATLDREWTVRLAAQEAVRSVSA